MGGHRNYVPSFEELGERCLLSAGFVQTNLISNVPGVAQTLDANLINPWGMAGGSAGSFMFSNNKAGVATADSGFPAVAVPGASWMGSPTGVALNASQGFAIAQGQKSAPSLFLFAGEDGTIAGWNPLVSVDHAILAVNRSTLPGNGPVYTGLTLAANDHGVFLLAANFRTGAIDIFDQNFHQVASHGAFADPSLPAGYVPFNIQAIGNSLYVTFTQQNGGEYDRNIGPGNGYVDVFDVQGHLQQRLASQGPLNIPWGVAVAPSNFGAFSNAVLVGNFGDGHINAFDPHSGAYLGALTDATGTDIAVPGLWSLHFGGEQTSGKPPTLFFTAGVGGEDDGLFGSLQPSGPGVAPSADFAAQQQLLRAIQNSPHDEDDYPLPPVQGPALQQTTSPPKPNLVAEFTLAESPFAMVPALATTASNQAPLAGVPQQSQVVAVVADSQSAAAPSLSAQSTDVSVVQVETTEPGAVNNVVTHGGQADRLPGQGVMANLYAQFTISESQSRAVDSLGVSNAVQSPHLGVTVATLPSAGIVLSPTIDDEPEGNLEAGEDPLVTWIPVAVLGFVFTGCAIRWATSSRYRNPPLLAAPARS
jgi:uncharacterized protein (TIGR03118 family)